MIEDRYFTAQEIAEWLTSICPGPLGNLDTTFPSEREALAELEGYVEHMEAGDFKIGLTAEEICEKHARRSHAQKGRIS